MCFYGCDVIILSMQAGALENIIKQSQLEIIELKHTVDELRYLLLYRVSWIACVIV